MSGLALFRRNRQSQELVQAPSADLIKSDNELVIPEAEEIQCELTLEELEGYSTIASGLIGQNNALRKERLWHNLVSKGFRNYPALKVSSFMAIQINHAARNGTIAPDMWWYWIKIQDYKHPLPPQVIKKMELIISSYEENVFFLISDIVMVTNRFSSLDKNTDHSISIKEQIINKRSTEVCFLRINLHEDAGPRESLIIDAWRGPTFSDEEARLP